MGKQTTLTWNLKPVSIIFSEVKLIPPSVSELDNCGLDERLAEVAAVVAGYIAKKVFRYYLFRLQKILNF